MHILVISVAKRPLLALICPNITPSEQPNEHARMRADKTTRLSEQKQQLGKLRHESNVVLNEFKAFRIC